MAWAHHGHETTAEGRFSVEPLGVARGFAGRGDHEWAKTLRACQWEAMVLWESRETRVGVAVSSSGAVTSHLASGWGSNEGWTMYASGSGTMARACALPGQVDFSVSGGPCSMTVSSPARSPFDRGTHETRRFITRKRSRAAFTRQANGAPWGGGLSRRGGSG
jgi:hypothetical protein